jgi:hypothetical protein
MLYEQRVLVKIEFHKKMDECRGEEFEDFFHDVMVRRFDDYIDIRAWGKIGDRGADGLRVNARELYACYAPLVIDMKAIRKKFKSDLESAARQRGGEFDTFIFVSNDRWGTHPDISMILSEAQAAMPHLSFSSMGTRRLWNEILHLDIGHCEDLFGRIKAEEVVYGIGLADLEPLLDHLISARREIARDYQVHIPDTRKMKYNKISPEYREELTRGMRDTPLVGEYIQGMNDPMLEDEMAEGFAYHYRWSRAERGDDADQVMEDMASYVLGNRRPGLRQHVAAWAIITFFFERCHIFEPAPDGWVPEPTGGTGS